MTSRLPRIVVIDDLLGRTVADRVNEERSAVCGQLLLQDETGDESSSAQAIERPVARAVFLRGQRPVRAVSGDTVENDLEGTIEAVRCGWNPADPREAPWALAVVDLTFYTGRVTPQSERRRGLGMPEGREGDDDPKRYFGIRLLESLHAQFPLLPVIVFSSMPKDPVKLEYTRRGVQAFLPKGDPGAADRLFELLNRYGLLPDREGRIVGHAPRLLDALRDARLWAATGHTLRQAGGESRPSVGKACLISGEEGTGKELMARYVRANDPLRRDKPLVEMDAGTLAPELAHSALFGHRKGAFTNAISDRTGAVFEADGGYLYLDEIGNLRGEVQKILLRALEERSAAPLSGDERSFDVKFLFATNRSLDRDAFGAEGLLERLKRGGVINLPPLRERPEDVPLLVESFLRGHEASIGAVKREVDPEALHMLRAYRWPGNLRELNNVLYRAVLRFQDVEFLVPDHLPGEISGRAEGGAGKRADEVPVGAGVAATMLADKASTVPAGPRGEETLDALIERIAAFRFDEEPSASLESRLPALRAAVGGLFARYLGRALAEKRRRTPGAPEGRLLPTPALHWMSGDFSLTPSEVNSLVLKLSKVSEPPDPLWDSDERLRSALERAARNRGRRPRP